jgi:hypothetical protein
VDEARERYRDLHVVIIGERSGADGVEEVVVDDMSSSAVLSKKIVRSHGMNDAVASSVPAAARRYSSSLYAVMLTVNRDG